MTKRMIIMLLAVAIVLGGVFGFQVFKGMMIKKFMAAGGNPPQTVATTIAAAQDWQPEIKSVGNLRAAKGADLAAEMGGIVDEIHFESGDIVEEGTMLLRLRSDDDMARLRALQASAKLAEIIYQRNEKQLKAQAISQATLDSDAANLDAAKAQVSEQRANIEKKIILAPFSGRIGIRAVDVGQYLSPGTTVVTLQQLDPIYLDFYLPQQDMPKLHAGQKVTVHTDAYPNQEFEGDITALNAKVETSTRNILVRAALKNPDQLLLPGMFANVSVAIGEPQKQLTLPQTAISYNPYGNTVYIVEDQGQDDKGAAKLIAKQTFVTTGETRGDQVAVLTGIKEGDTIVSVGQMKLHNGSPLVINNEIQPTNDPAPKPEDK